MKLKVAHHQRKSDIGHLSIERLFAALRTEMSVGVECTVVGCTRLSVGLWNRVANLIHAWRHRLEVNHILGDVHYLALALPKRGLVLTIHDCCPLHRTKGLKHWLLRWLWYEWPSRRARVVTTVSERSKAELMKFTTCPSSKIRVIPNISPVRPQGACGGNRESKSQGQPFTVLQVGVAWNKNLSGVLSALKGMSSIVLRIVGQLSPSQMAEVNESGVPAEVLGQCSDKELEAAYRSADVVVFASLYEGFGLPILEAQAFGKPVITSDLAPMNEVCGQGALLVDPMNPETIRSAVDRLRGEAELRSKLVEAGSANLSRFSSSEVAKAYVEAYREALEPNPARTALA